jgi:pimeloyl-ACP methyl ester carboxylesterase
MPISNLNGIDLYWEMQGNGPRLVVLNGLSGTIERTRAFTDRLATRFEILMLDPRGLGLTEIPPGPYSMADYAADVAALADHVGWSRFGVFSISFGGMIALELAVTNPERVERLALLSTSSGGAGGASYPLHELPPVTTPEGWAAIRPLIDTREVVDPGVQVPVPSRRPMHRRAIRSIRAMWRRFRPRPVPVPDPEAARGLREQLEARRLHDVWDRLPLITCPTFVGSGRFDAIAPLVNAENMVTRIPNAELHVYEGGHLFFMQDDAALAEILDFLDG